MISLATLQTAAEQGFIYSLVALALYLSYRTLDIADALLPFSQVDDLLPDLLP